MTSEDRFSRIQAFVKSAARMNCLLNGIRISLRALILVSMQGCERREQELFRRAETYAVETDKVRKAAEAFMEESNRMSTPWKGFQKLSGPAKKVSGINWNRSLLQWEVVVGGKAILYEKYLIKFTSEIVLDTKHNVISNTEPVLQITEIRDVRMSSDGPSMIRFTTNQASLAGAEAQAFLQGVFDQEVLGFSILSNASVKNASAALQ